MNKKQSNKPESIEVEQVAVEKAPIEATPIEFNSSALSIIEKHGKYLLVESKFNPDVMQAGGYVRVLATESTKMEIEEKFRIKSWDMFFAYK